MSAGLGWAAMALVLASLVGCASAAGGDCCGAPARGLVRHVVLFKFKDDAPPDQVRAIEAKFRELKLKIPAIQDFEWGTNISPENRSEGFTHCFVLTFRDAAARDSYLPHPAHKEFGAQLRPCLDKVLVIDYLSRD
ncbi:MAG TPA: Dabb family protein [Planctomycetota bacterium]|nr:Dabb family protein [Planctomycetota bacterium]